MEGDNISATKRPHESLPGAENEAEHPAKKTAVGLDSGNHVSDSVIIPHRLVDSIVGQNGEVLAKFEAESGAQISCEPKSSDPGDQTVHTLVIQGSQAQVTKAKQLLTQLIGQSTTSENESGIAGAFPAAVPGVGLIRPNIVAGLLANVGLAGRGLPPLLGSAPGTAPAGPQLPLNAPQPPNNGSTPQGIGNNFPYPNVAAGGQPTPGPVSGMALPPMPPGHERFEIMVTRSSAGLVIGKGGENIKRLQAETGCRIQVIQDGAYNNAQEKPLRVEGPREAVQFARMKISEIISTDIHTAGIVSPANRMEFPVPRESVGSIIGKGGETIKRIQAETGVNIQFKPDAGEMTPTRTAVLTGNPECLPNAKKMIDEIIGSGNASDGKPGVSVHVPVPSKHTGLIIGRGGENIRQMQTESGAHIELVRDMVLPGGDKVFLVRGSSQQCAMAENLIRSKFENSDAQNPTPYRSAEPVSVPTGDSSSSAVANISTDQLVKYVQTGKFEAKPAAGAVSEEQQLAQLQAAGQMWAMQSAAMQGSAVQSAVPGQQGGSTGNGDMQAAWAQYYQQYMSQYNTTGGYNATAVQGATGYQNYGSAPVAGGQYQSGQYQYPPNMQAGAQGMPPQQGATPGAPAAPTAPTGPPAGMGGMPSGAAPSGPPPAGPPTGAPYNSGPPQYGQPQQPQGQPGPPQQQGQGQYGGPGGYGQYNPSYGGQPPQSAPQQGGPPPRQQPPQQPQHHQQQHPPPGQHPQHHPAQRPPLLGQPPSGHYPPNQQRPPHPGPSQPPPNEQARWSSQYPGAAGGQR